MPYSYNSKPRDDNRSEPQTPIFRSLEFNESRQRSVWMSIVVHGVL
jgi:hypothetical protein